MSLRNFASIRSFGSKQFIYVKSNIVMICMFYLKQTRVNMSALIISHVYFRLPDGFTQLLNVTHLYLNDTFLDYLPGNFGR